MIRYLKIHGSKGWKPKQYCGACEDVTEEVAKIKAFMKKSATEHVKTAFLYSEAKREIDALKKELEHARNDIFQLWKQGCMIGNVTELQKSELANGYKYNNSFVGIYQCIQADLIKQGKVKESECILASD